MKLIPSWLIDFVIAVVLAACLMIAIKPSVVHSQTIPIELTKEESVQLLKLQFQLESALQQREQFMVQLFSKYRLAQDKWNLDIPNCRFVPKEAK